MCSLDLGFRGWLIQLADVHRTCLVPMHSLARRQTTSGILLLTFILFGSLTVMNMLLGVLVEAGKAGNATVATSHKDPDREKHTFST